MSREIICKKCGSEDGYYVKSYIRGSSQTYFDKFGEYKDDGSNSSMYDHLSHKEGKVAYCTNCSLKIQTLQRRSKQEK